jgi:hypothetical protein
LSIAIEAETGFDALLLFCESQSSFQVLSKGLTTHPGKPVMFMKLNARGGVAACKQRLKDDLKVLGVNTLTPMFDSLKLHALPLLPEKEPVLNEVPPPPPPPR